MAVCCLALLLAIGTTMMASATEVAEYELKGALIYNLSLFTEWPADAFADANSTFNVCLLGGNPFDSALDSLNGKKIKNRPVSIKYIREAGHAKSCQVLFIGQSETEDIGRIIGQMGEWPVLTVMDRPGMAQRGIIINMVLENRRVGFEINTTAAAKARLVISSKVLKLARVVY